MFVRFGRRQSSIEAHYEQKIKKNKNPAPQRVDVAGWLAFEFVEL